MKPELIAATLVARRFFARTSMGGRLWLAIAAATVLTACGGGGGAEVIFDGSKATVASGSSIVHTNVNAIVLDQTQTALISVQKNSAGDDVVSIPANMASAEAVKVGKTLLVLPGQDYRYPLGFVGEISEIKTDALGQKSATLVPTTLADVVDYSKVDQAPVTLSADNFVGVIAAPSVSTAMQTVPNAPTLASWQTGLVAMNGALVMRTANPSGLERVMSGLSILGNSGSLDLGEIAINTELKLSKVTSDSSVLKPYGAGADGKVGV